MAGPTAKVVIPAAGLGTRLLPVTKEQPKEMLPIFAGRTNGGLAVKPLVQAIFEQLYGFGAREFCFVVGRGKRAIVDHFTPDLAFVEKLNKAGRIQQAEDLRSFYEAITKSMLTWVNQPEPLGFGHSLLMANSFTGRSHFVVHAGDTYIIPSEGSHLTRMAKAHENNHAEATMLLVHVPPTKGYGFAVVQGPGPTYLVKEVVEKPAKPPSDLAIMPIYIFGPAIMEELNFVRPGVGGEVQLTDGIQRMIEKGYKVQAVLLSKDDIRLDIGTPENYWEALKMSHRKFAGEK